jgi:hypothetical protein
MTEHCIIKADFADFRRVKGRKVMQLFLEIPLEEAEAALRVLGHPRVGESTWCAIALLNSEAVKAEGQAEQREAAPKKSWSELKRSQQAYLLTHDPSFGAYFGADGATRCDTKLKDHFRIEHKSELDDPKNRARWDEFVALYHMHRDRLK